MRWLKPFLFLTVVFFSLPLRAQDAAPPPEPPPAPSTPPAPPPLAAPSQVFDGEQPPARPVQRPAVRRREPEPEPRSTGFGMEAATAGFASGALQGGVLLGAHTPGGSIFGVRFNYSDVTQKSGGTSHSTTAYAFGLGGRFPVIGSQTGFDLAMAIDAGYVKAKVSASSGIPGDPGMSGSGFQVGFGPQLRYWIHPNVAVGYLVQLSYITLSDDNPNSVGEKDEESHTGVVGAFTLTAGF